jgi:hypothetical protein
MIKPAHILELQSAVQAASDRLADALLDGSDTTEARAALDQARDALAKHQDAQQAAEQERQAAESEAFEIGVTEAEAVATRVALKVVTDVVEQAPLPEGVVVPEPTGYAAVARAAAEMARIQAVLDRGAPLRQKAGNEVAALRSRVDAKRASVQAIRTRRLAGQEEGGDAAEMALLEADAVDLEALLEAALARKNATHAPAQALRKQLAEAQEKLVEAQLAAMMHALGDRLRAVEQSLIAGARALRATLDGNGLHGRLAEFWCPTEGLRKIAYGMAV